MHTIVYLTICIWLCVAIALVIFHRTNANNKRSLRHELRQAHSLILNQKTSFERIQGMTEDEVARLSGLISKCLGSVPVKPLVENDWHGSQIELLKALTELRLIIADIMLAYQNQLVRQPEVKPLSPQLQKA